MTNKLCVSKKLMEAPSTSSLKSFPCIDLLECAGGSFCYFQNSCSKDILRLASLVTVCPGNWANWGLCLKAHLPVLGSVLTYSSSNDCYQPQQYTFGSHNVHLRPGPGVHSELCESTQPGRHRFQEVLTHNNEPEIGPTHPSLWLVLRDDLRQVMAQRTGWF